MSKSRRRRQSRLPPPIAGGVSSGWRVSTAKGRGLSSPNRIVHICKVGWASGPVRCWILQQEFLFWRVSPFSWRMRSTPIALNRNARDLPAVTQRTSQTIDWNVYPLRIPPARERLLLIVSAAGQPPSLKLIGKTEVALGYWTGDAFRVMSGFLRPRLMSADWQPAVTYWARLAPCLPQGIDLVHDRRFDPDVRD